MTIYVSSSLNETGRYLRLTASGAPLVVIVIPTTDPRELDWL